MKTSFYIILLAVFSLTACSSDDKAAPGSPDAPIDQNLLPGTWKLSDIFFDGPPVADSIRRGMEIQKQRILATGVRISFNPNKSFTEVVGNQQQEGVWSILDEKTISMQYTGQSSSNTLPIYSLSDFVMIVKMDDAKYIFTRQTPLNETPTGGQPNASPSGANPSAPSQTPANNQPQDLPIVPENNNTQTPQAPNQ